MCVGYSLVAEGRKEGRSKEVLHNIEGRQGTKNEGRT